MSWFRQPSCILQSRPDTRSDCPHGWMLDKLSVRKWGHYVGRKNSQPTWTRDLEKPQTTSQKKQPKMKRQKKIDIVMVIHRELSPMRGSNPQP